MPEFHVYPQSNFNQALDAEKPAKVLYIGND